MAQAGRFERVCQVCESVNQPSVCVTCINHSVAERQRSLKRVAQQRDILREKLEAKLSVKDEAELQRRWKAEHAEHRKSLLEQIRSAREEFARSKAKLEQGQQQLRERQSQLADASVQLAAKRKELLAQYYPDLLKAQALGHAVLVAELTRVRRVMLRMLRSILPIKLAVVYVPNTWDGVKPLNQAVLICGARLPDGDDVASMPSPEVSAALGYLVQAVDLVAKYLNAPVLHSSGFAGSSSRVWQRTSFWDSRPTPRSAEYPLFLPRAVPAAGGGPEDGGSPSANSSAAGPEGPGGAQAPKPAGRSAGSVGPEVLAASIGSAPGGSAGGGGSAGPGMHVDEGNRKEMRKGIQLLRRSVACMCAHEWALSGSQPPQKMSPFAVLAVLLSTLTREPRPHASSGTRTAEQSMFGKQPRAWGQGSLMENGALFVGPPERPILHLREVVMSGGTALDYDEEQERDDMSRYEEGGREAEGREDAFEGWDLIERPSLPPPPSRAEDVEHWTRAMFLDAR